MVMSMCEMKASGYGLVPKKVMLDNEISFTSKAIYAYFCSLSGNKGISFPSLKKILNDLKMDRGTFSKHLRYLKDKKYIFLNKKPFARTTYIVYSSGNDVENSNNDICGNYDKDIAKSTSMKASMPKSTMPKISPTINNNIISNNSISNNNISNNINRGYIEEDTHAITPPKKFLNLKSEETNLNLKSYDSKHSASEKPMEYESIKKEFDVVPSKVKVPSNDADDKLVLLNSENGKETLKEFMARCNLSNELFNSMYQYIVNRNLRKKGMSYGALRLLIANLKKIAPTIEMQREILDQSTINCWNNVYPIKDPPSSAPPPYGFRQKSHRAVADDSACKPYLRDKDGNCAVDEERLKESRSVCQAMMERVKALKAEKEATKSTKKSNSNEIYARRMMGLMRC